jgi:hypothetical protein
MEKIFDPKESQNPMGGQIAGIEPMTLPDTGRNSIIGEKNAILESLPAPVKPTDQQHPLTFNNTKIGLEGKTDGFKTVIIASQLLAGVVSEESVEVFPNIPRRNRHGVLKAVMVKDPTGARRCGQFLGKVDPKLAVQSLEKPPGELFPDIPDPPDMKERILAAMR